MRAVILSGGSEIVAAALVEELGRAGMTVGVISLGGKSILRRALPDLPYAEIAWPPASAEAGADRLLPILRAWGLGESVRSIVFPTEDGGLRLLLEQGQRIESAAEFGRARELKMGGLDKAELFECLQRRGCADLVAPTLTVESPRAALQAIDGMEGECVVKPALKPLSMQLTGMPGKAFMTTQFARRGDFERALTAAWGVSKRWVVQPRLAPSPSGEAVFWGVRDRHGDLVGMTAIERWKQPLGGGTGCWVTSGNALIGELQPRAQRILAAIDFIGMCELPFLLDQNDQWRLLELNPRPWLQVGLAAAAGAPLAAMTCRVLQGGRVEAIQPRDGVSWVNLERLLIAAWSGEQGSRYHALLKACEVWRRADALAIYGSRLPHIRSRWIKRLALKALERARP
jgi:hypothetical protein